MFGSSPRGANAYSKVGIETGVMSASPHKLIAMLFEGAMTSISNAVTQMNTGNTAEKGKSISKAISIVDEGLRSCLNKEAGGELAHNLDALYEYMSMRLVLANVKNDPQILQEVHGLLGEIKGAWDEIGKTETPKVVSMPPPKNSSYDPLAPRVSNLVRA